ncbi:MAG: HTTM domain-containing protein [Planctomycetaceae bacterium]|nr:HTTM domain-containing protein [Planctomycetaceae bacterium]
MAVEFYRYFHADWIGRYRIEPDFQIKYFGFAWVQPLPGSGMYLIFLAWAY